MQRQIGYSDDGARRVAKATRWVENNKRTKPLAARNDKGLGDWRFFAEITGQDTTDKRKYSWKMLYFQDVVESTDVLATNAGFLQGHWDWQEESEAENNYLPYAVDIHGSEYVIEGDIVELFPSPDQEYFYFDYTPEKRQAKIVSSDEIPGRQGAILGTATVTLEVSEDGTNSDDGTCTIFNNFRKTIPGKSGGERYIQIAYSKKDKCWLVDAGDCLTSDENSDST